MVGPKADSKVIVLCSHMSGQGILAADLAPVFGAAGVSLKVGRQHLGEFSEVRPVSARLAGIKGRRLQYRAEPTVAVYRANRCLVWLLEFGLDVTLSICSPDTKVFWFHFDLFRYVYLPFLPSGLSTVAYNMNLLSILLFSQQPSEVG